MKLATTVGLVAAAGLTTGTFAQPTIDGTADPSYGAEVAVQDTQTNFGDSNVGAPDFANGSEIDGLYAQIAGGNLYLLFSGNLESNFNKIEIFIDSVPGGQNTLQGDNPDVDFNGLNRMGDDGTNPGLTFDAGFEADYYLMTSGGNDPYEHYPNFARLRTATDVGIGAFLGTGTAQSDGTLTGGDNFAGILMTIDNSNVLGVDGGSGVSDGSGVTTGVEMCIPLTAIGCPTGDVKVCAFINGFAHDFLANQVIGGIGGGDNLGEPRVVDFNNVPGDQFVTIDASGATLPFNLKVDTLTGGVPASFNVSNGTPNAPVFIGYSTSGLGSTPIPPLGVTVDLNNPVELGRTQTNANGNATITATPPAIAVGFRVYFQAVQTGKKTNVHAAIVN